MVAILAQQCPCRSGSARPWLLLVTVLACMFAYDRYAAYRRKKGDFTMSKKLMIGLALGIAALLSIVVFVTREKPSTTDESASSFNVPALTPVAVQGTGRPRLVDLGATECIPCKKMAPILEELKTEYASGMDVEFIDVWQPQNQAQAQVYGVQQIPTQVFLDPNGLELWRHVGFISREDILAKWEEMGYDLDQ